MFIRLDDKNFEHVLHGEPLAVVGFGAPWCATCRRFLPVLRNAVKSLQIPLYEVVVDESPETIARFDIEPLPIRYSVRGVPTVVVFAGEKELGRFAGVFPEGEVARRIRAILEDSQAA